MISEDEKVFLKETFKVDERFAREYIGGSRKRISRFMRSLMRVAEHERKKEMHSLD